MRRIIFAWVLAIVLPLVLVGVASAAPPDPCVPGVEIYQITDAVTHNILQVTETTTCHPDGMVDDITVTTETVAYWFSNSRGQGYYMTAAEYQAWLDAQRTGGAGPGSGRAGR